MFSSNAKNAYGAFVMRIVQTLLTALVVFFAAAATLCAQEFTLSSKSFKQGERLSKQQEFAGFGCSGANLSPELSWQGAPKDTKSFAISVYDPDAPTGSGWWHWTLFNLPTNVTMLKEGISSQPNGLPQGAVQGRTDYGSSLFGGACPPQGDKPHRYIVTVFALDVAKLDLDKDASGALVGYFLNKHAIKKASITGLYSRE
jgi:Raf kinase inhibitor-like YbhB/YbcL family protein